MLLLLLLQLLSIKQACFACLLVLDSRLLQHGFPCTWGDRRGEGLCL
jgi:hypothetical protein